MSEHNSKSRGGGEQNLTVALRIRPMNEDEILIGATAIAHKVDENMVVLMDPMEDPDDILRANRSREKTFVFDNCFAGSTSQEEVYESTTKFLISNVITGYNATVFAYGATGAGKTYTMLGTDDEPGIMARTLNDLFLQMERTSDDMAYKVTMSYLEIYNEMIRDLLNPSSGILDLREDAKGGVQVAGLSEVKARSTDEVMQVLMQGNKERTQEPTAANQTSSRSHAVLQVIVRQQNRVRNIMQEVRTGKLFLIDLAGSERAANTLNRGKRMVEGAHINRSLLALGNCINALIDKHHKGYVNYRDSKLTRLLKDALGGNCKTVMIAHISPASIHFEESRNTLVYADRAKHIKTKVRRNVTDVAYHIAQYTNIIQELREEINRLRSKLQQNTGPVKSASTGKANIQAVQSEVLEAKRNADREELVKLKEQLLISFKDQMELRKSLMELNNATMEISLETNRNQMVVSEYEVEKARAGKAENPDQSLESIWKDSEKAMELSGIGTDELSEPEEIKVAREEMKVLHEEKHRTEKIRTTVKKELEMARAKTRKLEESIPQKIHADDQREVLRLLCKVHELELTNTEVQSSCLLRDFQIKKKDMVITRYRQHQTLCDQIIQKQKVLLEDHNVIMNNDLEELFELYKLERLLQREDSDDFAPTEYKLPAIATDFDQLSTLTEESEPVMRSRLSKLPPKSRDELRTSHSDDKIFTPSPRGKRLDKAWKFNDSNSSGERMSPTDVPPPRPLEVISPSRVSQEDRTVIATNTRNIAALAAKKRNKKQADNINFDRLLPGEPRSLFRPSNKQTDDYLTPSRLDIHDKYVESLYPPVLKPPSDDNLSIITKNTATTDNSLPPLRKTGKFVIDDYSRGGRSFWEQEKPTKANKRGKEISYAQQFAKQNSKKHQKNGPKTDRGVYPSRSREPSIGENRDMFLDIPTTPYSDKSRKTKRKYRSQLPLPENSNISIPQSRGKKPPPTIPNYRKGDITVAGFSLPRY